MVRLAAPSRSARRLLRGLAPGRTWPRSNGEVGRSTDTPTFPLRTVRCKVRLAQASAARPIRASNEAPRTLDFTRVGDRRADTLGSERESAFDVVCRCRL